MMIKQCVVLISVLVAVGQAQRSFYAGSASYPRVLTRFLDEQNSSTTSKSMTSSILISRLGTSSPPITSTPVPQNVDIVPPGYEYDPEFMKRVATWPRDKQPFNFVNRGAIQEHLHPVTQASVLRPGANSQSFFAGK